MSVLESIIGIQEPVKATIWYALNNYLHEDAIFLAERLHTEVCSLDSAYLLATCYYRSGRVQQAKHLLTKARDLANTANTAQCNLLYARCCLDLKDYKSGLIALNGLLCIQDFSEADIAAKYGADVGVAFWLLGELNSHLNQTKEAVKFFKAALKYNPFLWTAYQSLCELGEFVDPKHYFKISDYPSFLDSCVGSLSTQPSLMSQSAPPPSSNPLSPQAGGPGSVENEVDLVCTEQSEMETGPTATLAVMGGATSAFTSVESKANVVTPNLYGNPAVGSAVASSTPAAARSLMFGGREGQAALPLGLTDKGLPGSMLAFKDIRAALVFSNSSAQSSLPGSHVTESRSHMTGRTLPPAVTPLAPSFGVLSFDTPAEPGSSAHKLRSPSKLLDFSRVTPSPSPSPVATNAPPFTPAPVSHPLMVSASAEKFQNGEGMSHAEVTTPPGTVSTPNLFKVPAAPKSEAPLRRSTRLRNTSKGRLSEHAIHSTRNVSKSRLKSPTSNRKSLTDMPKKGPKVSFNTPLNAHNLAQSGVTSPKPQSTKSTSPLRPATPLRENREDKGTHRRKEQPSVALEYDSVRDGEVGGAKCDHLQLLISQQLTQQKRAAMSGLSSLLQLMDQLATAYRALCSYELGTAIRLFNALPSHHRETAWVKGQVARAYFAGERFKKCAQLYREVHHMDPHRQEGMDLYASSLWHLQREVELSVVAETLYSSNKLRPESLCAMASVMNLNRNHESAIKFLTRAIQIAPRYSYAHSLLGHEYWITKVYDKALSSFQDAVTVNPRLYNAWYGMAHVHYAQEKYQFAESYASRALSINKCSSIACTQLALAQFRLGDLRKALQSLGQAIAIHSSNPIPRFHRAKVLEAVGRPEDALAELDILTSQWPKEPELYITKGKILKSLNRNHEAVLQFSWALDFSRNVQSSHIREQIDQVYHEHTSHRVEPRDGGDFVPYPDPDDAGYDDSFRSVDQEAGSDESMIS